MKWLHNLLKCFSFSAVLFTFQACYGDDSGYDYFEDIKFIVIDKNGMCIPDVEIMSKTKSTDDWTYLIGTTDKKGTVYGQDIYSECDSVWFKFKPKDYYQEMDTVVKYSGQTKYVITLDKK